MSNPVSRTSRVIELTDNSGVYEQEIFDCENPTSIIVSSHGNGVRRWDGKKFYYQVADHFTDSVVLLVDQNQPVDDGVKLNDFQTMVSRVQELLDLAKENYKEVPIWIMGHSMGCPISCLLNLDGIAGVIFVAPAVGAPEKTMIERYGENIVNGKKVVTSDGYTKIIPKEYYDSVRGLVWEDEYEKLMQRFSPVHVFESGDDEIVGEGRFAHRKIPFTSYQIIEGAKHNFQYRFSEELFAKIDKILEL